LIKANLGEVVLASGNAFAISLAGNDLINFSLKQPVKGGSVTQTQTGRIIANGGNVLITALAAQGVLDNIINVNGMIQARSISQKNGQIIIAGDPNAVL